MCMYILICKRPWDETFYGKLSAALDDLWWAVACDPQQFIITTGTLWNYEKTLLIYWAMFNSYVHIYQMV